MKFYIKDFFNQLVLCLASPVLDYIGKLRIWLNLLGLLLLTLSKPYIKLSLDTIQSREY